jgi:hypothetical protein
LQPPLRDAGCADNVRIPLDVAGFILITLAALHA